ncbi:MAG: ABC transporter permease [Vulcanimicrobiaceae bacterium]
MVVLLALLIVPLILVGDQSFRLFTPGYAGARPGAPFTFQNYAELLTPAYGRYFFDTFRIGAEASIAALIVSFPIAYRVAREDRGALRRLWIGFLIAMLFLSILVRVYAIDLAFGPSGFGRSLAALLGVGLNSRSYAEVTIILALIHSLIPLATLSLIGPLQNLNPHFIEAAEALGAPRWRAHATITIPLSTRGLLAAFMLCFTFCISAFVIPMILGKGRILFVSNLVFSRFGEVANYPGGAAMAILVLAISLCVVYLVTRLSQARWES